MFVFVVVSLVLFSLVAAAFLANKDVYIANKFAKLHANRLNKRENITKRFREGLLFWNTVYCTTA